MTTSNIVSRCAPQTFSATAPGRSLSPVRTAAGPARQLSPSRMPSPRPSSPAIRPTSPLSPRYDMQARFDSSQQSSARPMHSRAGNGGRRAQINSLKLPSLPRFHPANYPSAQSSVQATPESGFSSPQPPMSPRSHQRMYSDAQKQLYQYQRESLAAAHARSSSPGMLEKPASPRLDPAGSPGPVTPLELEREEGYLSAGIRSSAGDYADSQELVERLIKEETRRQRENQNIRRGHR